MTPRYLIDLRCADCGYVHQNADEDDMRIWEDEGCPNGHAGMVSPETIRMSRVAEVTYSCGCKRSQVGAIRLDGTSACPTHKVGAAA